ncbi:MAG: anthranilate phosphoribosyltransferase [Candidatus Omnitrophota bacterium]|nr:MAG: anthranilate phosphoribosyltransferase [Candidatus Omnitrophota bacterium]
MIREAIKLLSQTKDLPQEVIYNSMLEIMEGIATPAQIAAFLMGLRLKGETSEEIAISARVMREKAIRISPRVDKMIDTCGTGGDGLHTFNISTLVAFAISAWGIGVAKHGNRSVSSSCGSADLIESLGINLELTPQVLERGIEEVGFGFLFAPRFHPAMKYATPVRKEIGIRTIFNILGPLANPAQPGYQILGVYSESLLGIIVQALKTLGLKSAIVLHSRDGMDEISIFSSTKAYILKDEKIEALEIIPEEFGIPSYNLNDIVVSSKQEAVEKAEKVLKGEEGADLDIVSLNAGWALYILDEVDTPHKGFQEIKKLFKDGTVLKKVREIKDYYKNAISG